MTLHWYRRRIVLTTAGSMVAAFVIAAGVDTRPVNGTIWTANRGVHSIRGFDAASGELVATIDMAPLSQPGDLAYAKGKLYVSEEFGTPPAVAIVDVDTRSVTGRITFPSGSRPHHVHASVDGHLVAVGLFGTDQVAVIDTQSDTLIGAWDTDPATTTGRIHAAVFSKEGNTLYLANEAGNELIALDPMTGIRLWSMTVPAIHELAVTHDGKRAYVSRRTVNRVGLVDLEAHTFEDILILGLPDTLRLSSNEKILTVGLRTTPAQMAVVDTTTLTYQLVDLSVPGDVGTIGGHQWTSPSGRYTFGSWEGGVSPGVAVIDHRAGNIVVQRLPYAGRPHGVEHAQP